MSGAAAGFATQRRVVGALLLRELQARFGRENLGFVWLFLEPAILGGAIGTVHHVTGHGLPGGLEPFVFWVLGYVPYYLFRGVVNRSSVAIVSNQTLLYHRHVTLLDIMVSRNLLEGGAVGVATAFFVGFFGLVMGIWPADPVLMIGAVLAMLGIAHGIALLVAAGSVHTDLFERFIHLGTYLALPITGAFFMVCWLPTELAEQALLVPTVHAFEMLRHGQFGDAVPTTYDIPYMIAWIAVLNLLGMAALRHARRKLVV